MTGFRLLAEYDVPLDEIDEPSLSEFSEYWHTKAGDRGFVTRDDISPADLIGGLGLIRIAMIEPDGGFRFRLYGSKATNPDQVDMTGKTTKDYADRHSPRWSNDITAWSQRTGSDGVGMSSDLLTQAATSTNVSCCR